MSDITDPAAKTIAQVVKERDEARQQIAMLDQVCEVMHLHIQIAQMTCQARDLHGALNQAKADLDAMVRAGGQLLVARGDVGALLGANGNDIGRRIRAAKGQDPVAAQQERLQQLRLMWGQTWTTIYHLVDRMKELTAPPRPKDEKPAEEKAPPDRAEIQEGEPEFSPGGVILPG